MRIFLNGEIYNYPDLRDRLKAKGHVFTSDADTEVLLYAYREYGQSMVDHLREMFAFAIWDEEKCALLLARVHFGIKPLYFHHDADTFRADQGQGEIARRIDAHLTRQVRDLKDIDFQQVTLLCGNCRHSHWSGM